MEIQPIEQDDFAPWASSDEEKDDAELDDSECKDEEDGLSDNEQPLKKRIKMEELLSEIGMKSTHRSKIDLWINSFSLFLSNLKRTKLKKIEDIKWIKKKGRFPLHHSFIRKFNKSNIRFCFAPPEKVTPIGSYDHRTITTGCSVDVMLTLPEFCMNRRDWQNFRWLVRRTLYLSWLLGKLRKQKDLVGDIQWVYQDDNTLRPLLKVAPPGHLGKHWKILLFPVPPDQYFQMFRFSPTSSNIRWSWVYEKEDDKAVSTPYYNWNCAVDVSMAYHNKLISSYIGQNLNVIHGIQLIKVWLSQRDLKNGYSCFSGHFWHLLVIHLIQNRKIVKQMSAYQVFRTVLQFFSKFFFKRIIIAIIDYILESCDLDKNPYFMTYEGQEHGRPTPKDFKEHFPVVFIDPSGIINITAFINIQSFNRVKLECEDALEVLNSSSENFESLFIKRVEFPLYFDQLLQINITTDDLDFRFVEKYKEKSLDFLGDVQHFFWQDILHTLQQALRRRVILIQAWKEHIPPFKKKSGFMKQNYVLNIGFLLDEHNAFSLLTKGPSAEDSESEEFRKFWGDMSTLRRFQDGTFHEAVLWGLPHDTIGVRRRIVSAICSYVLKFHFKIDIDKLIFSSGELEKVLEKQSDIRYGTGEEATADVILAFDRLVSHLRSVELPIKVINVYSTSAVIRHCEVYPPAKISKSVAKKTCIENEGVLLPSSSDVPVYTPAIQVLMFLEMSGKWPKELIAVQAIKGEFYIQMANQLNLKGIKAKVFSEYLQILWDDYVFQARIGYRKEIQLLRYTQLPSGIYEIQDTLESIKLEKNICVFPSLSAAISSVQAIHASFGTAVRLSKRWLSSQLMFPHIPNILVELLLSNLYLSPAPYSVPHTPQVAFLRFLQLLVSTDWKTTLLFISFDEKFNVEDITYLNAKFLADRDSFPPVAVVTSFDIQGEREDSEESNARRFRLVSIWTRDAPSKPIIFRLKQLAATALEFLMANIMKSSISCMPIFRPSLTDFDVVIYLNEKMLPRFGESLDVTTASSRSKKQKELLEGTVMPVVDFDPATVYAQNLCACFGKYALFFHDQHGGSVIGVVWHPSVLENKEMKVTNFCGHYVTNQNPPKMAVNIEAIIDDFRTLGDDLVFNIFEKS